MADPDKVIPVWRHRTVLVTLVTEIRNTHFRDGDIAQWQKCLLGKCMILSSIPNTHLPKKKYAFLLPTHLHRTSTAPAKQ